eukprot:TRINITY_DN2319_c0_g1_i1.p1 TRINITY_DN2319_c0_g1~~TRINITY_DN2319_c0_g1_i1.p1  ORF type:complete len:494 (-),score=67.99 TRINITY_DN2319_c0_g1_i1:71-1552(-)
MQKLWDGVKKAEREIRKSKDSQDVDTARNRLRDFCVEIILSDLEFACSKEVDLVLWRLAFYKRIEEFRHKLRVEPDCISAFTHFIDEATDSLLYLFEKLKSAHPLEDLVEENGTSPILLVLHHLSLFLGDLARYNAMYTDGEFGKAISFYKQAIVLCPEQGNPHNQLATIAACKDNEFEAIYHYCRSLASVNPFATSKENLLLLFEKNRQRYIASIAKLKPKHAPEINSKNFFIRFDRSHGILFSQSGHEFFHGLCQETSQLLSGLLAQHDMEEETLLKIMVLNILAVEQAIVTTDLQQRTYLETSQRRIFVDLALSLVFSVLQIYLEHAMANPMNLWRFLGPISVAFMWLNQSSQAREPKKNVDSVLPLLIQLLDLVHNVQNNLSSEHLVPEDVELLGFCFIRGLPTVPRDLDAAPTGSNPQTISERVLRLRHAANYLVQMKFLSFDPLTKRYFLPQQSTPVASLTIDPEDDEEIVFQGLGDDSAPAPLQFV